MANYVTNLRSPQRRSKKNLHTSQEFITDGITSVAMSQKKALEAIALLALNRTLHLSILPKCNSPPSQTALTEKSSLLNRLYLSPGGFEGYEGHEGHEA